MAAGLRLSDHACHAAVTTMRVMQVVSGRGVNGAVIYCLRLSRALAARGHEVTVLCRPDAWIAANLGGTIAIVESPMQPLSAGDQRAAAHVVRDRRIDVCHSHQSRAHFFGTILRRVSGCPVVATAHSQWFQPHWRWNNHVLCVSEGVRRYHRRWNRVPDQRLSVVYPFVDVPSTPPRVRPASGPLTVGILGRVVREKRVHLALEAFAHADMPALRLKVIGDGPPPYLAHLRERARVLRIDDRIEWRGQVEDPMAELATVDVLLHCSPSETFGLALAEAMAVGVPVVAAGSEGAVECLGDAGVIVPDAERASLGNALRVLLSDAGDRARRAQAGRARAARLFAQDAHVTRIEAVFDQVTSHAG